MANRILHVINSLARTGLARQLFLLCGGLVKSGWEVHVAALRPIGTMDEEFRTAGIAVAHMARRWNADPLADLMLVRHAARLRPDIIHTWDTVPGMLAGVPLPMLGRGAQRRRRLIVGDYHIDRNRSAWEWAVCRCFSRYVDQFVTSSEAVRDWLIAHGIPGKKLNVIKPAAPPVRMSDVSREALLIELGLPPGAKLIGVVGRLIHEKRVKDLIWAADLLRVLHDNLRMLIIGDGPLREQLRRYASLASDLEHVRFLGERADAWRIIPHLDVLWNASENTGPSQAVLEAMAAGVPVVASDTASNRELITHGETGFLIPPGTRAGRAARARATDRIFHDAQLARRIGQTATERIAEPSRFIAQYEIVYDLI
jgi:glycosyltransferase involved in cell wall biosynthesis